jgi:hypothetical protein
MADRVCLIATVRSPVNELLEFARYHLAAGVEKIVLFFDDPDDPAAAALADVGKVVSIRCDAAYWAARRMQKPDAIEHRQIANANFALQIARAEGYDWIAHIDSDELLLAERPLGLVLAEYSADVVRFDIKEAVAEQDFYVCRFETTLFRQPLTEDRRKRLASIAPADIQGILFEGEYFRAHTVSKAAVRLNSRIESMGIHGPRSPRLSEVQTPKIVLLHYDCIGIDDWRRKWVRRLDASGTATGMRAARVTQMKLFAQAYGDESAERALYALMHKVTERQKELLLGLDLMTVVRRA